MALTVKERTELPLILLKYVISRARCAKCTYIPSIVLLGKNSKIEKLKFSGGTNIVFQSVAKILSAAKHMGYAIGILYYINCIKWLFLM